MTDRRDTIAAVATGAGRAGVGIIRVSGPQVPVIAVALTGNNLTPRAALYLPFRDAHNSVIDSGIAIRFEAPHSFTGEHVLELQGHGGPVVLDLILARVIECGARLARPGEFTERAFLNGKLDLAQAEAVADLIDSSSGAAARAAVRSMVGDFSSDVQRISDEIVALRVWLEAALDFSEDDIDFLADQQLVRRARSLLERFVVLLAKARQGQRLRDGLTVVIAGNTNVGKSSLLNALSGADSAIVTDIAGTTRDLLHEHINLEGLPLHIVDTAGLRDSDDLVEQKGMQRAQQAMASADHLLILADVVGRELPQASLPANIPRTLVINKIDLLEDTQPVRPADAIAGSLPADWLAADWLAVMTHAASTSIENGETLTVLPISVKTGQGVNELRKHLMSLAGHDPQLEGAFIARRRHLDALQQAQAATKEALARLTEGKMPELAAEELRLAQQALDTITGKFDSEDLLGRIFADFCIGK